MELTSGLDRPCFGYSIALFVPKDAKDGKPFYVSGCRYFGGLHVLFEFDREKSAFQVAGVDAVERNSGHEGTAVGRYAGFPAAFVSYIKNTPRKRGARHLRRRRLRLLPRRRDLEAEARSSSGWASSARRRRRSPSATSTATASTTSFSPTISSHRVRVFFQTKGGEFEELAEALQPTFVNAASAVRIADVDGDGRPDIVLMLHYLTGHETRAGGFRFFRNLPSP